MRSASIRAASPGVSPASRGSSTSSDGGNSLTSSSR
jgi:hypothetical protein